MDQFKSGAMLTLATLAAAPLANVKLAAASVGITEKRCFSSFRIRAEQYAISAMYY